MKDIMLLGEKCALLSWRSSSKIQPASNDPSNNDSSMLFKSLENSFRSDEDEMTPIQNTANMEASLGQMIRGHRKGSTTTISTEGKASKPSVVPPRRLSLGLVSVKEREQMSKLSMSILKGCVNNQVECMFILLAFSVFRLPNGLSS